MLNIFKRLVKEEEGQGMAEYGLILALVACVVLIALGAVGTGVNTNFNTVAGKLTGSGT